MPLRICFATAEMAPLAKAGGLGDVAGALFKFLHAGGHDVRLFLPDYATLRHAGVERHALESLQDIPVQIGTGHYRFSIQVARLPGSGASVYLVDCPALYARPAIYGSAPDEHRRFLLLTHAAFLGCQRLGFAPQILHCNDWHTAVGALWLRSVYAWDRLFRHTRSVLTIHNIGYQGVVGAAAREEVLPGADASLLHQDDLRAGRISLLRLGAMYADLLTTVSPTYAREIQTAEYGMGLDDTLRQRASALIGILNGVDYDEWDPRVDAHLPRHFGANQLGVKAELKEELRARLGLDATEQRPLIGVVARLVAQKGIDLMMAALPQLLARRDFDCVVLGNGERSYEEFFADLQRRHPRRVSFHCGYDEALAHWIEAAGDMFLMPSRYEPCGLNQLYSMRYGTVPIVRRTGGLADSVRHFDTATGQGTGIVFSDYDAGALLWAVNHALDLYRQKGHWRRLMHNGMAQDFSWQRQVQQYVAQYERLTG